MPRLFVAVAPPAGAIEKLIALQPPQTPGVRLTQPGQMHLTLHYIGEEDVQRTATALARVQRPTFRMVLQGAG